MLTPTRGVVSCAVTWPLMTTARLGDTRREGEGSGTQRRSLDVLYRSYNATAVRHLGGQGLVLPAVEGDISWEDVGAVLPHQEVDAVVEGA